MLSGFPNGPTEGARKGLTMQVLDAADLRGCTPAENNRYNSKGRDLNRFSSRRYLAANKELKKEKKEKETPSARARYHYFFLHRTVVKLILFFAGILTVGSLPAR